MLDFICNGSAELKGRETSEKFKMKIYVPPGIEPATLCVLAGHLVRLAIATADYLCFKLFQYSEVTGNACGVSKHAPIQWIKLILIKYVLQQTFR